MPLWTDIITPVEATAVARVRQAELEMEKGRLSRFLPNVFVPSTHVKFKVGAHGLVDNARYRQFNAPPEIGRGEQAADRVVSLAAISREEEIDELTQMEMAHLPDDQVRKSVEAAIRRSVEATTQTQEATRGQVIHRGIAATTQGNYYLNDDFGRDPALTVTASTLWSNAAADALGQLAQWIEVYAAKNNGDEPGLILGSRATFSAFSNLSQFRTVLAGGSSRPPMAGEVQGIVEAAGFPTFELYNRSTSWGLVLPKEYIYLLPAPVDPFSETPSALGATYWGRTLTATKPGFGIAAGEQPGIVVGAFQEEGVPPLTKVQSDSIGLPVAQDANKVMAIKVL